MKALINPNEIVVHIESWTETGEPISKNIGLRVVDVADVVFEVAEPLYWLDCPNDVNRDEFYFDVENDQFKVRPQDALKPIATYVSIPSSENQPVSQGTQTL